MTQTMQNNIKPFINRRKLLLSYKSLRLENARTMDGGERLRELLDDGSFEELFADLKTKDPLEFPGYGEKLEGARRLTQAQDAFVCGRGSVCGIRIFCGELSRHFMMGSMGSVAGEKIAALAEMAGAEGLPLVIFAASGGARMQEGMFSLMQMAKTAAAVEKFKSSGGLFISVLTDPCMGGVSASFASLGDICLAEPGALIGFAGPRVIEQTIRQKLPEGFQRAEFALEHGFVDRIVPREEMPQVIKGILELHKKQSGERPVESPRIFIRENAGAAKLSPWERVCAARDKDRPKTQELIEGIFDGYTEFAGDRTGGDDRAVTGGIAFLKGRPVTVIGHRKGRNAHENMDCNFGMPGPEGYRKALRLMRQAEKFGRPVITFIDTPGAYPGTEAEENGISIAIAESLAAMSGLKIPVIAVVTGEGSSGGALAIGVADRVWMLENAVYSILSPEGFSSILWKDSSKVEDAASVMRLTAFDLKEDGFADEIIREPEEGLAAGLEEFCESLGDALFLELEKLESLDADDLVNERYERYRGM